MGDLTRWKSNTWDNFNKKYMKIKFNCDDNFNLGPCNMIIVVRYVFHEGKKYYPKVLLDQSFYEL